MIEIIGGLLAALTVVLVIYFWGITGIVITFMAVFGFHIGYRLVTGSWLSD